MTGTDVGQGGVPGSEVASAATWHAEVTSVRRDQPRRAFAPSPGRGGGVMRRSLVIGIVLCVCTVVVPATVSGATPRRELPRSSATRTVATKSKPSLSAHPSTGLLDGQSITVNGSGFGANVTVGTVECRTGATTQSGCDFDTLTVVIASGAGAFTEHYRAVRQISVGTATIDCAKPHSCVLGAAYETTATVNAETPISFADVAIKPPQVSAVPDKGLRDQQKITVSGEKFSPNAEIVIAECQAPATASDCDITTSAPAKADATGSFSTPYAVTRVINPGSGPIDCAHPKACVLSAMNELEPTQTASTAITFADVRIIPPRLSASPSKNLHDGQDITVTGEHFRPHDSIDISECPAGATNAFECVLGGGIGNVVAPTAGLSGRFTVTFNVARILTLIGGTLDCAHPPGCVLGAVDLRDLSLSLDATRSIGFDPHIPPLPRSTSPYTSTGPGGSSRPGQA